MFELSNYVHNRPLRERIVGRIKAQTGFEHVGGSMHDQCYFSGAVKLLLTLETLDLPLLHCGKLAIEDVARVKRISKTSTLTLPSFVTDLSQYVHILQEMRSVNELSMVCKQ